MNVRRSLGSLALAPVLAALPLVASCGFDAPTTQVYTPAVGVSDQAGTVDVLNVLIVSGTDGSGTVVAGLANNDRSEGDSLADLTAAGDDEAVQVELTGPTDIDPGGFLDLSDDGGATVSGADVVPGGFVTLTFTFERAASVTVDAPVVEHSFEGPYRDVPVD